MKIGDIVKLTVECLGNSPGARGVVYDLYQDFDDVTKQGASIIFENGEYDGFSLKEQSSFLEKEHTDFVPSHIREYKFENVIKLSQDFERGNWKEIFNK